MVFRDSHRVLPCSNRSDNPSHYLLVDNICLAGYINSSCQSFQSTYRGIATKPNCKLVYSRIANFFYIEAIKDIEPEHELFYNYAADDTTFDVDRHEALESSQPEQTDHDDAEWMNSDRT
jgi:SET domain-containing protein